MVSSEHCDAAGGQSRAIMTDAGKRPAAEGPPPYKLALVLVIAASVVAKAQMLQNLSIDSLAALALTGNAGVSTFPATCMQLGSMVGTVGDGADF